MTRELELYDGQVVCKYDDQTGEIEDLCDWNGNNVSYRVERVAEEAVREAMERRKDASPAEQLSQRIK